VPTAGRKEQTAVALHTHCFITQQYTAQLNLFALTKLQLKVIASVAVVMFLTSLSARFALHNSVAPQNLSCSYDFTFRHHSCRNTSPLRECFLGFSDYSYAFFNTLSENLFSVKQVVKPIHVLLLVKPNATVLGSFEGMPQSMTYPTYTYTD